MSHKAYICNRNTLIIIMNRILSIFFLMLFFSAYAQEDIDSLAMVREGSVWDFKDSVVGGGLTIKLDPRIEQNLIRLEEGECTRVVTVSVPKQPEELSPATRCAQQQKIMGYKIQIYSTRDRELANKVRMEFSRNFPGLTPELVYAGPDWRILVGDYFTRQTARRDMKRIQKSYPAAFTVQWRVWCRKAI